MNPEEGKYGYTYAFYLNQSEKQSAAIDVLQTMVKRQIPYPDAYALLGAIYQKRGELGKAVEVYQSAVKNKRISQQDRTSFETMMKRF